jgi:hypothetical protein
MRGFIKLAFGISALAMAVISAPACSSDDSSGSGGSSTGGTGGTATGGSGGSDAGTTCGTNTCSGWKVGGLINVSACCAGAGDECGGLVDKTLSGLMGFPEGCYKLDQPGTIDCGCPSYFFTNPLDGKPSQYNGCCTSGGKCGYSVDITSKAGPNFGCAPLTDVGGPDISCTVGSETPPPADPDGGEGDCPNPDAGTGGSAGAAGGGGTAGAVSDAGTD